MANLIIDRLNLAKENKGDTVLTLPQLPDVRRQKKVGKHKAGRLDGKEHNIQTYKNPTRYAIKHQRIEAYRQHYNSISVERAWAFYMLTGTQMKAKSSAS